MLRYTRLRTPWGHPIFSQILPLGPSLSQWLWSFSLTKIKIWRWGVGRHTPASRGLICPQPSPSVVVGLDMPASTHFVGTGTPRMCLMGRHGWLLFYFAMCWLTFPSWHTVRKPSEAEKKPKGLKANLCLLHLVNSLTAWSCVEMTRARERDCHSPQGRPQRKDSY